MRQRPYAGGFVESSHFVLLLLLGCASLVACRDVRQSTLAA